MTNSEQQYVEVTPEDAHAALLVLDEYVDDASMEMRESLIRVCEQLHEVAKDR